MRNPDRLPDVLAEIYSIWQKMPDMRLGQLIMAVGGEDLFFMEDEVLVKKIHDMFDEAESPQDQENNND